jgi:hypothetical protein
MLCNEPLISLCINPRDCQRHFMFYHQGVGRTSTQEDYNDQKKIETKVVKNKKKKKTPKGPSLNLWLPVTISLLCVKILIK